MSAALMSTQRAFYDALDLGLSVIPGVPKTKKPYIPWKEYQDRRPTVKELDGWLRQWPDANPLVITGAVSGVIGMDVDGAEGHHSLAAEYSPLPKTWKDRTGRGNHFYFRYPGFEVITKAGILPGVDSRGNGGLLVFPPSLHRSGSRYEWENSPEDTQLADAPDWWLKLVRREAPGPAFEPDPHFAEHIRSNGNNARYTAYVRAALQAEGDAVRNAPQGRRNDTLNRAAYSMGGYLWTGVIADRDIEDALGQAARAAGLDPHEIRATIRSGTLAGQREPRQLPDAPSNSRPTPKAEPEPQSPPADTPTRAQDQPVHVPSSFTAAELMALELPAPRWAVENLIPAGLCILAGAPKRGKSWLGLGLAVAVASGGVALGCIQVEAGDVLYLALEDNPRRLQDRLRIMLGADVKKTPLDRLRLATECKRLDAGGLPAIEEWVLAHQKGARLVIVDTWARIRPRRQRSNSSAYDDDYSDMSGLQAISQRYGIAILVITHLRKMAADDPLETVNGTMGLTGAADAVLVLQRERGRHDASLYLRGRDVEEKEWALLWNNDIATWTLGGDAEEFRRSQARQEIIDTLRREGRAMGPKEVSDATGKKYDAVKKMMWTMSNDGELHTTGYGLYTLRNR